MGLWFLWVVGWSREALSSPCGLRLPRNSKKSKNPQKLPNLRHLNQVSYDLFCNRNKAKRHPLRKKAILLLPGDVYMLTLRMDALAVQFIQSHTAFKKIQNFFFFPGSVLKLLSLLPFLLLVFIALFSSPICS